MSEGDKIAAAILACEASRQQQEMVRLGLGNTPGARDVAALVAGMRVNLTRRVYGFSLGDVFPR